MKNAILRRIAIGLCVAQVSTAFLATAAFAEPGEKWKITSSMAMAGMTMPGQTVVVCSAKGSTQAPTSEQQKNCTISNVRHSGNKDTVHMRCMMNGKATEAEMETERLGPDHFRSVMHMQSAQGNMDMISESQKVPGACDTKDNAKAVMQQGKDRMKKMLGH